MFEFYFTGNVKTKWLTSLPDIFNKEVTWLKINKWTINLLLCSSDLYLFRNLRNNSVWKFLTVFPVNDFSVFNQQMLYVGCESIPGFTSACNSLEL